MRLIRSTNNGYIVDIAEGDVVNESVIDIYLIIYKEAELLTILSKFQSCLLRIRLRWNQGNFSLDLTGLDPADSGEWFCTVNSRAQYLNSHSLLVKGNNMFI